MKQSDTVSKGYAILHAKCGRCRQGDLFKPGFLSQKMHTDCACCNLHFERHPGYFYVSMFVSYALIVAEIVTLSVATYVLSGGSESPGLYAVTILPAILILSPFNFRFSRVLQIHLLDPGLKYQPSACRDDRQSKPSSAAITEGSKSMGISASEKMAV